MPPVNDMKCIQLDSMVNWKVEELWRFLRWTLLKKGKIFQCIYFYIEVYISQIEYI